MVHRDHHKNLLQEQNRTTSSQQNFVKVKSKVEKFELPQTKVETRHTKQTLLLFRALACVETALRRQ